MRTAGVGTDRKVTAMAAVAERVRAAYDDVTETDGVRVGLEDGWFPVRASGTQPLIRVTAEARAPETADRIHGTARRVVDEALAEVAAGSD